MDSWEEREPKGIPDPMTSCSENKMLGGGRRRNWGILGVMMFVFQVTIAWARALFS